MWARRARFSLAEYHVSSAVCFRSSSLIHTSKRRSPSTVKTDSSRSLARMRRAVSVSDFPVESRRTSV